MVLQTCSFRRGGSFGNGSRAGPGSGTGIGNRLPVATEVVPDPLGGVPRDGRLDVAVGVERDLDAGVAEAFLDHLRMDSRFQSEGRSGVSEVVLVPTSAQPRLCRPPRYADFGLRGVAG